MAKEEFPLYPDEESIFGLFYERLAFSTEKSYQDLYNKVAGYYLDHIMQLVPILTIEKIIYYTNKYMPPESKRHMNMNEFYQKVHADLLKNVDDKKYD